MSAPARGTSQINKYKKKKKRKNFTNKIQFDISDKKNFNLKTTNNIQLNNKCKQEKSIVHINKNYNLDELQK